MTSMLTCMSLLRQVAGQVLQLSGLPSQLICQVLGRLLPSSAALHLQVHTHSVRESDHSDHSSR